MILLSYKKYNRRIIKILLWKNKLSLVRYLHMYFTSSPSSPLHHACSRSPSSFLCIPPSYLISKSFTKQHEFHARDDFLAVQIEALKNPWFNLGLSNAPFVWLKKSSSSKFPSTGASLLKRMSWGEGRKREQGEGERKGGGGEKGKGV